MAQIPSSLSLLATSSELKWMKIDGCWAESKRANGTPTELHCEEDWALAQNDDLMSHLVQAKAVEPPQSVPLDLRSSPGRLDHADSHNSEPGSPNSIMQDNFSVSDTDSELGYPLRPDSPNDIMQHICSLVDADSELGYPLQVNAPVFEAGTSILSTAFEQFCREHDVPASFSDWSDTYIRTYEAGTSTQDVCMLTEGWNGAASQYPATWPAEEGAASTLNVWMPTEDAGEYAATGPAFEEETSAQQAHMGDSYWNGMMGQAWLGYPAPGWCSVPPGTWTSMPQQSEYEGNDANQFRHGGHKPKGQSFAPSSSKPKAKAQVSAKASSTSRIVSSPTTGGAQEPVSDLLAEQADKLIRQFQGSPEDVQVALAILKELGVRAACFEKNGCRVVQEAMKNLSENDTIDLASALQGWILRAIYSGNAIFVVLTILEVLKAKNAEWVAEELSDDILKVACHVYGCRVVKKFFDIFPEDHPLLRTVMQDVKELSLDESGKWVVGHVLTNGTENQKSQVADAIFTGLGAMIENKHGTYVIVTALECWSAQDNDKERLASLTTEVRAQNKELLASLTTRIFDDLRLLSLTMTDENGLGKCVVELVLANGTEEQKRNVARVLYESLGAMMEGKPGRNVVVAALKCWDAEQKANLAHTIVERKLVKLAITGKSGHQLLEAAYNLEAAYDACGEVWWKNFVRNEVHAVATELMGTNSSRFDETQGWDYEEVVAATMKAKEELKSLMKKGNAPNKMVAEKRDRVNTCGKVASALKVVGNARNEFLSPEYCPIPATPSHLHFHAGHSLAKSSGTTAEPAWQGD